MFAGKTEAYQNEQLSGAPLWDRLLALPENIRLYRDKCSSLK
jgi:hypothetical protein